MKNVLHIKKLDNLRLEQRLTLEEYGFIYYLYLKPYELELGEVLLDLDITLEDFKKLTKTLTNKGIITFDISNEDFVKAIWKINFITQEEKKLTNKKYEKLFFLTPEEIKLIDSVEDEKEVFLKLYRIYEKNPLKYIQKNTIVISNEEEYKQYLVGINPLVLLNNNGVELNIKSINLLFSLVYEKNFDIPMLNFLIEYVVSTSTYNNFSINYFLSILNNWQKNNIKNLDEAMNYVKVGKSKIKGNKSAYVEPEWDETTNDNINIKNDLDEINKLLQENQIK